jgi:hypothetical protein
VNKEKLERRAKMKKLICGIAVVLMLGGVCYAGRISELDRDYYDKPQIDERQLKRNPYNDTWNYETPESQLKYNPYEDKWQYKEPNERFKYNPYEDKWE